MSAQERRQRAIGSHVISLVIALFATHVTAAPHSTRPAAGAFVPSEYAPYDTAGTASISGTGFASPLHGIRTSIAGRTVILTPVTTWSRQWWERRVLGGNPIQNRDPRARTHLRQVTADTTGYFRFDHLPAGRYYLKSTVLNLNGRTDRPGATTTVVVLGKQVTLMAGRHLVVTLDSLRSEGAWFGEDQGLGPGEMNDARVPSDTSSRSAR